MDRCPSGDTIIAPPSTGVQRCGVHMMLIPSYDARPWCTCCYHCCCSGCVFRCVYWWFTREYDVPFATHTSVSFALFGTSSHLYLGDQRTVLVSRPTEWLIDRFNNPWHPVSSWHDCGESNTSSHFTGPPHHCTKKPRPKSSTMVEVALKRTPINSSWNFH